MFWRYLEENIVYWGIDIGEKGSIQIIRGGSCQGKAEQCSLRNRSCLSGGREGGFSGESESCAGEYMDDPEPLCCTEGGGYFPGVPGL